MISISYNIVSSSLYVTVFFSKIFFKQRFTLLTVLSYIPPNQGEATGLKFHVIFLELAYCCVTSVVKFELLSLKIEVGVPLLLKNCLNNTDVLYEGTDSKQILWVEEHVNKNMQALYVSLPSYIFCAYKGPDNR